MELSLRGVRDRTVSPGVTLAESGEHDRAKSVPQHPVLQVVSQSLGQHGLLDVPAEADHVGRGVRVIDPDHVLLDDRARVQFGTDVMAGRADHLDPANECLVVGPGAAERRQEAVVDVDQPALPRAAQLGRDHLHVPGQHDRIRIVARRPPA